LKGATFLDRHPPQFSTTVYTDDFYNGNAFDIGLRRHAPEILNGDLRIAILPLHKGAPIYMADKARPHFGSADSVAVLQRIEIIPRYQLELTAC